MSTEEIIKKAIKRFKRIFPGAEERLEKELIPLRPEEEIQPRIARKKKRV